MKKEIELLREIADEVKSEWDKGWLPLEAQHLKNLLTDYIDMKERAQPAIQADAETSPCEKCNIDDKFYCKHGCRVEGRTA